MQPTLTVATDGIMADFSSTEEADPHTVFSEEETVSKFFPMHRDLFLSINHGRNAVVTFAEPPFRNG